jgi:hypothetical protein
MLALKGLALTMNGGPFFIPLPVCRTFLVDTFYI